MDGSFRLHAQWHLVALFVGGALLLQFVLSFEFPSRRHASESQRQEFATILLEMHTGDDKPMLLSDANTTLVRDLVENLRKEDLHARKAGKEGRPLCRPSFPPKPYSLNGRQVQSQKRRACLWPLWIFRVSCTW
jgi:hypothetical protein